MRRTLSALVVALAIPAGGCGGGDSAVGAGTLVWQKAPVLVDAVNRSDDRVLMGTIRNDSLRPLSLTASKLRVRDAQGREVQAYVQFAASYAHGLYGAYQRPNPLPGEELRRLGLILRLDPGKTAPLAVSFRLRRGLEAPLSVDYGQGVLPIPARAVMPPRPR